MTLNLSPQEAEQFTEALLSAFPSQGSLRQLVFFRLGEQLNQLVSGGNYRDQVSELVQWAIANAKDGTLLREARQINPGNVKLESFDKQMQDRRTGDTQSIDIQPSLPPAAATQVEQLIFGRLRDTRLPAAFIAGAIEAGRGVARLSVPRVFRGRPNGEGVFGTGWLIAPGLLMTNHHVIEARDHRPPPWGLGEPPADPTDFEAQARQVVAWFDYHREGDEQFLECRNAKLVAFNKWLDYALIELVEADQVADREPLRVIAEQPVLSRGSRVNIVQHSNGGPLQYAIRNNFYVSEGDTSAHIRYQTDTEPGASGSPVCDDLWRVIALHHASVAVPPSKVPQEVVSGLPVEVTVLNEAIAIHSILESVPDTIRQKIMDTAA